MIGQNDDKNKKCDPLLSQKLGETSDDNKFMSGDLDVKGPLNKPSNGMDQKEEAPEAEPLA